MKHTSEQVKGEKIHAPIQRNGCPAIQKLIESLYKLCIEESLQGFSSFIFFVTLNHPTFCHLVQQGKIEVVDLKNIIDYAHIGNLCIYS